MIHNYQYQGVVPNIMNSTVDNDDNDTKNNDTNNNNNNDNSNDNDKIIDITIDNKKYSWQ